jgi:hypothetical protein
MFFREGGHFSRNAGSDNGANPRVADSQRIQIRPIGVFTAAMRICAVAMRTASDEQAAAMLYRFRRMWLDHARRFSPGMLASISDGAREGECAENGERRD